AICAFWGLARLAELTYDVEIGGTNWLNSVWKSDVMRTTTASITLNVRGAKTAKVGVHQKILLNRQPNILCPVAAIRRRLAVPGGPASSLFGYLDGVGIKHNLTRSAVVTRCTNIWFTRGWAGISGHSFRVGGASLRAALG
ncbi:hypothetical protein DFH28DRAFT_830811, partial [Melampsora americana]